MPPDSEQRASRALQLVSVSALLALAFAVTNLAPSTAAHAAPPPDELPTGGSVVQGSINITPLTSLDLLIQQTTPGGIINWNTFSIGEDASVTIQHPSADAVTFIRTITTAPSQIAGTLTSNGRVIIVNPNGITVLPSSISQTGGTVLSTLGMSNTDFNDGLATGSFRFGDVGQDLHADVTVEAGTALGTSGSIALLGGTVTNHGSLTALSGSIALGSAREARLDFLSDGLLDLTPSALGSDDGGVANSSSAVLRATRGVTVRAATYDGTPDTASGSIVHHGIIDTRRTGSAAAGNVVLSAPHGPVTIGSPDHGAAIDARGEAGSGGNVTVIGHTVDVTGGSGEPTSILASSVSGQGGHVLIDGTQSATLSALGSIPGGLIIDTGTSTGPAAGTVRINDLPGAGTVRVEGGVMIDASGASSSSAAGAIDIGNGSGLVDIADSSSGFPAVSALTQLRGATLRTAPLVAPLAATTYGLEAAGSASALPITSRAHATDLHVDGGVLSIDSAVVTCTSTSDGLVGRTVLTGVTSTAEGALPDVDTTEPVDLDIAGLGTVSINSLTSASSGDIDELSVIGLTLRDGTGPTTPLLLVSCLAATPPPPTTTTSTTSTTTTTTTVPIGPVPGVPLPGSTLPVTTTTTPGAVPPVATAPSTSLPAPPSTTSTTDAIAVPPVGELPATGSSGLQALNVAILLLLGGAAAVATTRRPGSSRASTPTRGT